VGPPVREGAGELIADNLQLAASLLVAGHDPMTLELLCNSPAGNARRVQLR